MANFNDYIASELNRTTDEKVKSTVIRKEPEHITIEYVMKNAKPEIWTAREIDGIKYLFFGGKKLNITDLKKQIDNLYSKNGYNNYGFSKLSESELVRYPKIKDILIKCFSVEHTDTLSPVNTAQRIYDNELNDLMWKPEDY